MSMMRTFFMICVPLFVLVTGYLMYKKEFSLKYYMGIKKVLGPYLIISIITFIAKLLLFKHGFFKDGQMNFFNGIIDFDLVGYAWYVDMYIGLFLLIPFLNKIFTNKLQDTVLISILIFLTVVPSFCSSPTFVVSQWVTIWSITYYCIGAYIAKYKIEYKIKNLLVLFLTSFIFFGAINILFTKNQVWSIHKIDDWGGFENTILATLFFIIFLNINFNKIPDICKNIISEIAKLSLGIYLFSYLFDNIYYHYLNFYITNTTAKLEYYIIIVPLVFVSSLIMAKLTDYIYIFIEQKILSLKIKR